MGYRGILFALIAVPALLLPGRAVGATEKTVYSFAGGTDGSTPVGGVVLDSQGNLFGVTNSGGNSDCNSSLSTGCGTVFELKANGDGTFSESVIHVFSQAEDGGQPLAPLVISGKGNLYGSTQYYGPDGEGTVWELTAASGGVWIAHILHTFNGVPGGFYCAGLSFDSQGRLFGTAYAGGSKNDGLVFRLAPQAGGTFSEAVLHNFTAGAKDGSSPSDAVIFDGQGKIYGTTYEGGPHLTGTVFEMQHGASGWTETPIYIFQGQPFGSGPDGTNPTSGVIFDKAGNLYGTTYYGGPFGVGTVYKLTPDGSGGWNESVIYTFRDGTDGGHPNALIIDGAGNLYGTTTGHNTFGSVFKLAPVAGGKWKFSVLYDFKDGVDGASPSGALVMGAGGNLYGTAEFGGANGFGVVFEIRP